MEQSHPVITNKFEEITTGNHWNEMTRLSRLGLDDKHLSNILFIQLFLTWRWRILLKITFGKLNSPFMESNAKHPYLYCKILIALWVIDGWYTSKYG